MLTSEVPLNNINEDDCSPFTLTPSGNLKVQRKHLIFVSSTVGIISTDHTLTKVRVREAVSSSNFLTDPSSSGGIKVEPGEGSSILTDTSISPQNSKEDSTLEYESSGLLNASSNECTCTSFAKKAMMSNRESLNPTHLGKANCNTVSGEHTISTDREAGYNNVNASSESGHIINAGKRNVSNNGDSTCTAYTNPLNISGHADPKSENHVQTISTNCGSTTSILSSSSTHPSKDIIFEASPKGITALLITPPILYGADSKRVASNELIYPEIMLYKDDPNSSSGLKSMSSISSVSTNPNDMLHEAVDPNSLTNLFSPDSSVTSFLSALTDSDEIVYEANHYNLPNKFMASPNINDIMYELGCISSSNSAICAHQDITREDLSATTFPKNSVWGIDPSSNPNVLSISTIPGNAVWETGSNVVTKDDSISSNLEETVWDNDSGIVGKYVTNPKSTFWTTGPIISTIDVRVSGNPAGAISTYPESIFSEAGSRSLTKLVSSSNSNMYLSSTDLNKVPSSSTDSNYSNGHSRCTNRNSNSFVKNNFRIATHRPHTMPMGKGIERGTAGRVEVKKDEFPSHNRDFKSIPKRIISRDNSSSNFNLHETGTTGQVKNAQTKPKSKIRRKHRRHKNGIHKDFSTATVIYTQNNISTMSTYGGDQKCASPEKPKCRPKQAPSASTCAFQESPAKVYSSVIHRSSSSSHNKIPRHSSRCWCKTKGTMSQTGYSTMGDSTVGINVSSSDCKRVRQEVSTSKSGFTTESKAYIEPKRIEGSTTNISIEKSDPNVQVLMNVSNLLSCSSSDSKDWQQEGCNNSFMASMTHNSPRVQALKNATNLTYSSSSDSKSAIQKDYISKYGPSVNHSFPEIQTAKNPSTLTSSSSTGSKGMTQESSARKRRVSTDSSSPAGQTVNNSSNLMSCSPSESKGRPRDVSPGKPVVSTNRSFLMVETSNNPSNPMANSSSDTDGMPLNGSTSKSGVPRDRSSSALQTVSTLTSSSSSDFKTVPQKSSTSKSGISAELSSSRVQVLNSSSEVKHKPQEHYSSKCKASTDISSSRVQVENNDSSLTSSSSSNYKSMSQDGSDSKSAVSMKHMTQMISDSSTHMSTSNHTKGIPQEDCTSKSEASTDFSFPRVKPLTNDFNVMSRTPRGSQGIPQKSLIYKSGVSKEVQFTRRQMLKNTSIVLSSSSNDPKCKSQEGSAIRSGPWLKHNIPKLRHPKNDSNHVPGIPRENSTSQSWVTPVVQGLNDILNRMSNFTSDAKDVPQEDSSMASSTHNSQVLKIGSRIISRDSQDVTQKGSTNQFKEYDFSRVQVYSDISNTHSLNNVVNMPQEEFKNQSRPHIHNKVKALNYMLNRMYISLSDPLKGMDHTDPPIKSTYSNSPKVQVIEYASNRIPLSDSQDATEDKSAIQSKAYVNYSYSKVQLLKDILNKMSSCLDDSKCNVNLKPTKRPRTFKEKTSLEVQGLNNVSDLMSSPDNDYKHVSSDPSSKPMIPTENASLHSFSDAKQVLPERYSDSSSMIQVLNNASNLLSTSSGIPREGYSNASMEHALSGDQILKDISSSSNEIKGALPQTSTDGSTAERTVSKSQVVKNVSNLTNSSNGILHGESSGLPKISTNNSSQTETLIQSISYKVSSTSLPNSTTESQDDITLATMSYNSSIYPSYTNFKVPDEISGKELDTSNKMPKADSSRPCEIGHTNLNMIRPTSSQISSCSSEYYNPFCKACNMSSISKAKKEEDFNSVPTAPTASKCSSMADFRKEFVIKVHDYSRSAVKPSYSSSCDTTDSSYTMGTVHKALAPDPPALAAVSSEYCQPADAELDSVPPASTYSSKDLQELTELHQLMGDPVDWEKVEIPNKEDPKEVTRRKIMNMENPDCAVHVGDKVFKCHLLVLTGYSSYFKHQFGQIDFEVPPNKVSPTMFSAVYRWMIGSAEDARREVVSGDVLDLLEAAQFLEVTELQDQCWAFIFNEEVFAEETALQLYLQARRKGNTAVMEMMEPRVVSSFLPLVSSPAWVQLPVDVVCALLSSNFIAVHCEMEVFMSAVKWLNHSWGTRSKYVIKLMQCVRFGLISAWQLVHLQRSTQNPEYHGVLAFPEVQQMLKRGLNYAIFRCRYCYPAPEYNKMRRTLGLPEPDARNWVGNDRLYKTYQEFMQVLNSYQQSIQSNMPTDRCNISTAVRNALVPQFVF